ncbi:hypothetical protein Ari01nite_23690 [Paractinoplanes rishiriensis]|uniref:Uncharacterized protein n=1 Tax=Paractinoplanes rishiriensis TaxID=1050105 RepID=A0A919JWJ0_9ACTN|nr:hypothetical protein Ari01nite_23690 [Actinoplanes rishiriensis]
MAGMGFDAHMLDATNETAKKHVGWLAYAAGAAQHLRDRPMQLRITLDDKPAEHGNLPGRRARPPQRGVWLERAEAVHFDQAEHLGAHGRAFRLGCGVQCGAVLRLAV